MWLFNVNAIHTTRTHEQTLVALEKDLQIRRITGARKGKKSGIEFYKKNDKNTWKCSEIVNYMWPPYHIQ